MSLISKQFRVFMAVVNHGSIKKASYELSLTSSPVSRMISELESYLGTSLFYRNGSGLTLTDSGFNLYNRLKPLYAEIKNIENTLRPRSGEEAKSIRIFYDWGNEPLIMQMQSKIENKKCEYNFEFFCFENKGELFTRFSSCKDIVLTTRSLDIAETSLTSMTFSDSLTIVYRNNSQFQDIPRKIILSQKQKLNPKIMQMANQICSTQRLEGFSVIGSCTLMHELVLEGKGISIVPSKYSLLSGWKDAFFDNSLIDRKVIFRTTLFHSISGNAEKAVRSLLHNIN